MSEAQTVSTTVHYYINSSHFLPLTTSLLSVQLDCVCVFNLDQYTAASAAFLTHPHTLPGEGEPAGEPAGASGEPAGPSRCP